MTSRVRWVHPPDRPAPPLEAGVQDVLHPVGGSRALAGETVGPGLPGTFLPGSLLAAGLGLDAGPPFGAARFGLSLQRLYPPLQLGDSVLLLGNDCQQGFSGGGRQVKARIHAVGLT